jgi:two-component system chemotaxis response regulator CheB
MIKVLIVDDSAVIRRLSSQILQRDPEIEVVGTAPDPYVARDLIVTRKPDVLTLDIEMPKMDGITFLKKLMHYYPLPVVVCSTLTSKGGEVALEAMAAGAVAVICKPSNDMSLTTMAADLVCAVKVAAQAKYRMPSAAAPPIAAPLRSSGVQILAIGASTGGTVAIEAVLRRLPENLPGTVIVQHMPPFFTKSFAGRLSRLCRVGVEEAQDGDLVRPGLALVAPGDRQMMLRRGPNGYCVAVVDGPRVSGHKPSVNVLFRSVAKIAGKCSVGVILTGMGADGAEGLLEMRKSGARTLGQDAESSVVYGMPKVAFDIGAVEHQVPLEHMAQRILNAIEG